MGHNFQSQRAKINALLRNESKSREVSVNDLRKQYIFALFLRRIFNAQDGRWLLLGGNALIIRTGGGRYTQDIDLAREESFDDVDAVKQELQQLVDDELFEESFRFVIDRMRMRTNNIDDYGYGTRAARAKVVAYLGAQVFEIFSLDVVPQRHPQTPAEWLPLRRVIDHESMDNLPKVPIASLESHLADKICAMYEMHRGGASTRMRDLADIVRIVQQLTFDAAILNDKLNHEHRRRKMTLPSSLESPGSNWYTDFPKAAKTFNGYPEELHALEDALHFAGKCLTPVLEGIRIQGVWRPKSQKWV